MSSTPPPQVPPATGTLPWEERSRLGALNALVETIKLFFTDPKGAFGRAAEKGDFMGPLLYAVVVSWIGWALSLIWRLLIPFGGLGMIPGMSRFGAPAVLGAGAILVQLVVAVIVIPIAMFVAAAIVHLCLMIVGGLGQSQSGFEGTFRALCYGATSNLANVVPVVGGLIALLWGIYLNVTGLVRMHKTTAGRALAAVLIPIFVCCGIFLIAAGTIAAIFLAGSRHRSL